MFYFRFYFLKSTELGVLGTVTVAQYPNLLNQLVLDVP